jgi:hypothetical protein
VELISKFPNTNTANTVRITVYSSNKYNAHRSRYVSGLLLGSAVTGGRGLFGDLPLWKEADLMTADEAIAGRCGPWSCWRGGRGPNQCVGPTEAVPVALTMAILNKSAKS